ncbi:MAG: dihydrolipoyl dehydrogenase [Akkermansia muciniphila]
MQYDLIVIGGGPAGYVGAIRAAQLGKSVVCVERERVGGTCLNWGCIPTKALLKNAEAYLTVTARAREFGMTVEGVSVDWSEVIGRSRKVSDRLAGGVGFLFKKNKVDSVTGEASIISPGRVEVKAADGTVNVLEGKNILVCTGCVTRTVPSLPLNGTTVIGSREAMVLEKRPESMIIIGSGAIGTEFAYIYNSFGTRVTLIEALPRMLPNEDDDSCMTLERAFKKQGIKVMTGASVESVTETCDGQVKASVKNSRGQEEEITADICLVAIGVKPVVPAAPGLDLELTEKGFIKVNDRYATSIPGVYAAGDVIGGVLLAHTASFEAVQAVEGMFNPDYQPRQVGFFPSCTYCYPQVASVGKRNAPSKRRAWNTRWGNSLPGHWQGCSRRRTGRFRKTLYGAKNGELLGAHIVGPEATELIAALGIGIQAELTDEDIHATIFAHPTLSEAIHESMLASEGIAIHM